MSIYAIFTKYDFSLLPALIVGWDDDDDFYIEIGWMNLGLGVVFG